MRVERIGLEDHRDATLRRRNLVHTLAVDGERAARNRLQPGDHAEQCGLAATGRANKHHKLAWLDAEIDAMYDFDFPVALDDAVQLDAGGHQAVPLVRRARTSSFDRLGVRSSPPSR